MTRVLIVGCGGIGGVLAASLAQLHALDGSLLARPTVLSRNAAISEAVQARGIRMVGVGGPMEGAVEMAASVDALDGPFDLILLATQPPQVEAAAASVVDRLAPDGRLVCLQNGLCEERIAGQVGADRVVGAVVSWGASAVEPGLVERTSSGGFVIGRLDGGTDDPALRTLETLLSAVGPVRVSANLRGARWSKLAINAAISTLGTIGGDRLGALMKHRVVRRLALEIMTETVAVGQADGVQFEKVSGTLDLPWLALTASERESTGSPSLLAKHAILLAVGSRYRKLRSSMLRAIEGGREPAVDFLNGEIVTRGEAHGIATPVNRAGQQMVHAIARGEVAMGMPSIHRLAQR